MLHWSSELTLQFMLLWFLQEVLCNKTYLHMNYSEAESKFAKVMKDMMCLWLKSMCLIFVTSSWFDFTNHPLTYITALSTEVHLSKYSWCTAYNTSSYLHHYHHHNHHSHHYTMRLEYISHWIDKWRQGPCTRYWREKKKKKWTKVTHYTSIYTMVFSHDQTLGNMKVVTNIKFSIYI